MKLAVKVVLVELVFFVTLIVGVVGAMLTVGLPELKDAEAMEKKVELKRIQQLVVQELEQLRLLAKDWGYWDDAYRYIEEPYAAFADSNLSADSIEVIQVDWLMMVNARNQIVANILSEKMPEAEQFSLTAHGLLDPEHPLYGLQQNNNFKALLLTEVGLMLVACSPIVTSDGGGPPRGIMVFGRLLDEAVVARMTEQSGIPFSTAIVAGKELAEEIVFVDRHHMQATELLAIGNSDDELLKISIYSPRPLYQMATKAFQFVLFTIILVSVVSCLLTYFMLSKILVRPILQVKRQIEHFRKTNDPTQILIQKRADEIGELSITVRGMAHSLSHSLEQIESERNKYRTESYTDALTGLRNRRYLTETLSALPPLHRGEQWCGFILDLDHFKRVNDEFGHAEGDVVLKQFAEVLNSHFRDNDIVVRSGGEEFVAFCHHVGPTEALSIASRLKAAMNDSLFGENRTIGVTVSMGFVCYEYIGEHSTSLPDKEMLLVADMGLYAAKNSGRNTWIGFGVRSSIIDSRWPASVEELKSLIQRSGLELYSEPSVSEVQWP